LVSADVEQPAISAATATSNTQDLRCGRRAERGESAEADDMGNLRESWDVSSG
jgi:hypothetical protein